MQRYMLENPRFNEDDDIEVEFKSADNYSSGTIVAELDPGEFGYNTIFRLTQPYEGSHIFRNPTREGSLDILQRQARLDECIRIAIKNLFFSKQS